MQQFLVDIKLPTTFSEKFLEHIPEQYEQIERMMDSNVVCSFSLSADRSKLWIIINAVDKKEAEEILHNFVLFEYFEAIITELFLYKEAPAQMPTISLN